MRIFTCTPVAFGGGPDFFARDSGLLCRGFQTIGVESRAVMPGDRSPGDEPDLIRTEFGNLESPEWWRSHHLDGVVLYAWGRPKFRKVAAAIQQAGIFLVLNQDNGGLVSPLAGFQDWLREQWVLAGQGRNVAAKLRFLQLTLRGLSAGLLITDPLRAWHLHQGDLIACVSPKAADCYRKLCRLYGGRGLVGRVTVIPHTVEPRFRYSGRTKQKQIACVGRWHDTVQKRPWLLMEVIGRLLEIDNTVRVVIAGQTTPELEAWQEGLPIEHRMRVELRGKIGREELATLLDESQVFYSPSAFESFGIAAAEALCCGCSVVAGRSVSMAAFEWFVSENSGILADDDNPETHALTLHEELDRCRLGERNPETIAITWQKRLHAPDVAAGIVSLLRLTHDV
jgi:glycosyltransferase involved in cell wall biosynthesis